MAFTLPKKSNSPNDTIPTDYSSDYQNNEGENNNNVDNTPQNNPISSTNPQNSRFVRNKMESNNPNENNSQTSNFVRNRGENRVQEPSAPMHNNPQNSKDSSVQNTGNGTQRFNRDNHPEFKEFSNVAKTNEGSAFARFIPAGATYSISEPSLAYQRKKEAGDMNMRFNVWGNAYTPNKNDRYSYPRELIIKEQRNVRPNAQQPTQNRAPAPIAPPVTSVSSTPTPKQEIPQRARSGFEIPLEEPTTPSPSNSPRVNSNPAPKNLNLSNGPTFAPKNNNNNGEFIPQTSIKTEQELLSEAFTNEKTTVNSEQSENHNKNLRFSSILKQMVDIKPKSLLEAYTNLVSLIDIEQQKINEAHAKKLAEIQAQAELAEKEAPKKRTKKKSDEGDAVENTKANVQPVKVSPNKDFIPKSNVGEESFDNITKFEGEDIHDLQKSAVSITELLNISNIHLSPSTKFNIPILEAISPESLLLVLKAEKKEDNQYLLGNNTFELQGNKWFNKTLNKGSKGTINLMKQLIAMENDIVENGNDSILFKAACQKLMNLLPEVNSLKEQQSKDESNARYAEYLKIIKAIDIIPLIDIMQYVGGRNNHKGARGRWKVSQNGHVYGIKDGWYSFTASQGGKGAIDFYSHVISQEHNLDYDNPQHKKELRKIAIKTLKQDFAHEISANIDLDDIPSFGIEFKETFFMPLILPQKQNAVKNYLHQKRGLPNWIINKQMASGTLFPGFPSDWQNRPDNLFSSELPDRYVYAVFLGANANGAEMRGIDRYDGTAKIQAKNSEKELGGHVVRAEKEYNEKMVCSLEAAIDSCSYNAIFPGRVAQSCMGVNYHLAVKIAIETLDSGFSYGFCFDNDLVGNINTIRFRKSLIEEISQEDYDKYYNTGKIKYFELGINCFKEQIKANERFYFDVNYDTDGQETFKMFYTELLKEFSKDELSRFFKTHQFYTYNITPDFELLKENNIPTLAQDIANSLITVNKPLYFLTEAPQLSESDKDDEDKVEDFEIKLGKYNNFMYHFYEALGKEKIEELKKRGAIIEKTSPFAKDWNEYLNKMIEVYPSFAQKQKEYEEHFKNIYTSDINIEAVAGKIKKKP